MVVCKYCKERVVSRSMTIREVMPEPNLTQDDMFSDPSTMILMFKCVKCNKIYSFSRVVTSDELREQKAKPDGCGGCGP